MGYSTTNNAKFGTNGNDNPMMLENGVYIDFDFTQVTLKSIGRNDNVGTGDVLVKSFDVHIQVDRLGSIGEFLY